jgi:hypothetical protein
MTPKPQNPKTPKPQSYENIYSLRILLIKNKWKKNQKKELKVIIIKRETFKTQMDKKAITKYYSQALIKTKVASHAAPKVVLKYLIRILLKIVIKEVSFTII